jgi:hypothetical protein
MQGKTFRSVSSSPGINHRPFTSVAAADVTSVSSEVRPRRPYVFMFSPVLGLESIDSVKDGFQIIYLQALGAIVIMESYCCFTTSIIFCPKPGYEGLKPPHSPRLNVE